MKIICNTKFKLDPFADGGSKRSVQIREILKDNEVCYIEDDFTLPKNTPLSTLIQWTSRAIVFIHKHYPKKGIKSLSQYVNLVKYFALRIPIVYDKYVNSDSVFCWENTNDKNMIYLMKATGCPVIALPHNIESLVNGYSSKSFNKEMDVLRQCDKVYTISKEESWLLRLIGINAYYLPYYPPKEAENMFLSIRERREERNKNERNKYLLLGSATNVPTLKGMQAIIDHIPSDTDYELIVAGYGTEALNCTKKDISFLGTISKEMLEKLLVEIDALVIYQPPTTGALTRIPEMLVAGIPIFANFDAARNFHNIDGITPYSSFDELSKLLLSFCPYIPKCQKEQMIDNSIIFGIFDLNYND